jgi:potassium-transporting ATPase KdpC subunit
MLARYIRPAGCLIIVMTLLLGVIYPIVITAAGSVLFPSKAGGSLMYAGQTLIGSRLIGQKFSDPQYFWGRPSATSPQPYNGLASGGSNFGPLNPALLDMIKSNVTLLHAADPGNARPIPVELVSASASGLDPDISLAAADYQATRVAALRHLPLSAIQSLIGQHETGPFLGIVGEPTVNVLELNLALDSLH